MSAPLDVAVETGQLLSDVAEFVRRFVVLTADQQSAVALWVLHTHARSTRPTRRPT
jgi:hypothetical protein